MSEPIKLTYNTINEKVDDLVYRAVTEVGIEIDKEKLIEAIELYSKVIYCKDCKYRKTTLGISECRLYSEDWLFTEVSDSDFCSKAEPKEKG